MATLRDDGKYLLLLFLSALALYFFKITMPLTDGDSAYYGTIARNIIRTGNWQTLQFGEIGYFDVGGPLMDNEGRDFVDKPPLSIWPIAVSYKLFGISDWSTKAWHALLAVACILLTYLLAREFYSPLASFWAAAVFLTMVLMFYAGQVPQQDVPVVFCLLIAFWGFLRYRRTGRIVWFYLPWLGAALAFMTRGLPGVVFTAGPIMLFWVARRLLPGEDSKPPSPGERGRRRMLLYWSVGLILFAVAGCLWYVLEYLARGPAFLNVFFQGGLTRFFRPMDKGAGGSSPLAIFPLLFGAALPWTGFIWPALKRGWAEGRKPQRTPLFLLCWFLVIFGLCFINQWKIIRYLLPCLPPLAILIGRIIEEAWGSPTEETRKAFKSAALIDLLLAIPVFLGLAYYSFNLVALEEQRRFLPLVLPFILPLLGGLVFFSLLSFLRKYRVAVRLLVSATALSYLLLLQTVAENISLVNPWPQLAVTVRETLRPGDAVIHLEPSLSTFAVFYLDTHPINAEPEAFLQRIGEEKKNGGRYLLLTNEELPLPTICARHLRRPYDLKQLDRAPMGQSVWLLALL